ncbi:MAG: maleylpyruvate isomerase N-terminal domain-containing protein [Actinomycetes bacterium]
MVEVLEASAYGEALGNAGSVLRSNAASAGMAAPVPTCPGWSVADLVLHQGIVHRWATDMVLGEPGRSTAEVRAEAEAASDVLDWFDDGLVDLLNALAKAPDDLQAYFFLPDAPPARLAWLRRQAHETTIHAVDAMAARLTRPPLASEVWVGTELAADGLDELLTGFLPRKRHVLGSDEPQRVLVAPSDAERAWLIELGAEAPAVTRVAADTDADVACAGTARQLYLGLWNRGDEVAVTGEVGWLDRWRESVRVTWS